MRWSSVDLNLKSLEKKIKNNQKDKSGLPHTQGNSGNFQIISGKL